MFKSNFYIGIRLGHLEKDINYKVKDLGVIKLQNLSCYLNVQLARHIKSPCFSSDLRADDKSELSVSLHGRLPLKK